MANTNSSASAKRSALLARMDAAIAEKSLLKHPFYQDWQAGKLSREALQLYAAQYYKHVEAFPKHLRVLAARTEGPLQGLIRENLAEEESPTGQHRSSGGILQRPWEYARTTLRAALLCLERRRGAKIPGDLRGPSGGRSSGGALRL